MTRFAPKHLPLPALARVHTPPETARTYGQGRGGRPWRRIRDAILKRDGHLCQPCKRADRLTLATQVDHVTPKAEGGTDADDNLQAICAQCHASKSQAEAARGRNGKGSHHRRARRAGLTGG